MQEFDDPLVLQPASLDVATVKKKAEDDVSVGLNSHSICNNVDGIDLWIQGMLIQTSYKGVHVIGGVKFQSPAHQCGKIEEGDELVQVNYQTVIGWEQKKLKSAMLENPTKVILTLKKRPRHSNNFGQIYVKPYRLPSKKRESYHYRWHLDGGQTKQELNSQSKLTHDPLTVPAVQVAPPVYLSPSSFLFFCFFFVFFFFIIYSPFWNIPLPYRLSRSSEVLQDLFVISLGETQTDLFRFLNSFADPFTLFDT